MRCPQCAKPMQTFELRGLELDRCRECGRVWLDLTEVERLFDGVHAALSEAEVDQPCPRGHGTMVSGTIGDHPAVVCSFCRGAWVIDTVSKAEPKAEPKPKPVPVTSFAQPARPKAAALRVNELKVSCEVCRRSVPLSEAANSNRGTVCRACELAAPTPASGSSDGTGPGWQAAQAVLDVLAALLS